MTKKIFTKKEQGQLNCNPNVQAFSEKAITYTHEFKRHFIAGNDKGKLPREIFEEAGLNVELIGLQRICSAGKRWQAYLSTIKDAETNEILAYEVLI